MDELANRADAASVAFRLEHLSDRRGRAVIEAAAKKAVWIPINPGDGRHERGFAFTRYKNISTYAAVVVDIDVDRSSGAIRILKAVAAVDAGRIINPDGVVSQSEGGIVQGLSWALKETMRFNATAITSVDWPGYPIMTFEDVPPIDSVLMDQHNEPSLGLARAR